MTWLSDLPGPALLVVAALIAFAESGLLIGVLLPVGAVLVLLGTQVATGTLLLLPTVLLIAAASVAGVCLGHRLSRAGAAADRGRPRGRLHRLVHDRTHGAAERAGRWLRRYPVISAAAGQCLVGTRTVVPRVAAAAGVPLRRLLPGTVPAAVIWSTVLIGGGTLLPAALAWLTRVLAGALHAALGPPLLVAAVVVAAIILRSADRVPALLSGGSR